MKASELIDKYQQWISYIQGNQDLEVTGTDHAGTDRPNSLVFASDEKDLDRALKGTATLIVVPEKLSSLAEQKISADSQCLAASKNVRLAMARINDAQFKYKLENHEWGEENIHPSSYVHPTAQIGNLVRIGPNSSIGAHVTIGAHTTVGANTTIGAHSSIGEECEIHSQVYISHHCEIGNRCEVHPQSSVGTEGFGYADDKNFDHYRVPHFGKSILQDDVHIGSGVNLDRGTFKDSIIRRGTKVDNHCHFGHNHDIGENCLITAGFILAGSTTIGNNFVCGGRTSVAGHIHVTDNVQISALTAITKSLDESGAFGGYPILKHRDAIRAYSTLPHLPEMRKMLKKIMKKLEL